MESIIIFKVNCIVEAKPKTEYTHAAEKLLSDVLKTCYVAASTSLKDALYTYLENFFPEMTFNITLEDLFIRSLELLSLAPELMKTFPWGVLVLRTFTHQPVTFFKGREEDINREYRLAIMKYK